jgi:outer membrane protein
MKSIRTLTIALASLIAVPALAQDATTDTATSSGKRFAVVGGAAILPA